MASGTERGRREATAAAQHLDTWQRGLQVREAITGDRDSTGNSRCLTRGVALSHRIQQQRTEEVIRSRVMRPG